MTTSDNAASTSERREQITKLLCDILEIDPAEITETSLFKEDHGADSLRAIEILAALERTFDITIDQAELSRMVNLEGVESVVDQAQSAR
ncbi:acyl carrier protein [Streptomyces sp. NBC_00250]|uniref:acyl carrier protein n=1 Tax=unclassified Streptomyces TaxID=2593676 RepID=UPI0022533440|nr:MULTISPECIES: acyl carrier protein [unclassified Streptomyces]MCX4984959.1 acyl carrier protein [Streptomyces sp. NBC_00572]